MPISGPVVHQQLMDAYNNLQADLDASRSEIIDSEQQRGELTGDRSDALVNLAQHYLPELTTEAIESTWVEARDAISQILFQKEDHVRRADERSKALESSRGEMDADLVSTSQRLDQALEDQQAVAAQVEQRLCEDGQFVELSNRAVVAEAALERAEANLDEIDQDAARKLPAYDESALFQYLYDRGFGTPSYTKRGFTRRMDRMLARYIGYSKAKQGYEFLRRTPEQMRQIIAEDREALDVVMDELERRRDEVADEFGLPEKLQRTTELEREREGLLVSLDQLQQESEQLQDEIADLEDTRGTYYQQAIERFREMLETCDSRDLRDRARATPEITDDQIVARLIGAELDIDEFDHSVKQRRKELDQQRKFVKDMGRVLQRFRAARFDASRSQFVGTLDIFEEVEEAAQHHDIDRLWQRIRKSQRWGSSDDGSVTHATANPLSQTMVNAMAYAAGKATGSIARRAGYRRANRDRGWTDGDESGSGMWNGGDSSADH